MKKIENKNFEDGIDIVMAHGDLIKSDIPKQGKYNGMGAHLERYLYKYDGKEYVIVFLVCDNGDKQNLRYTYRDSYNNKNDEHYKWEFNVFD